MKNRSIILAAAAIAALITAPALAEDVPVADKAELQSELDQTRDEIRRLSERLAELSLRLVDDPMIKMHKFRVGHGAGHSRVAMGVTIQSVSGEPGAEVLGVTPDGPADRAGIRTGDVIVGLGNERFDDDGASASPSITRFMSEVEVGDTITVQVERDGAPMTFDLVAEEIEFPQAFNFDFDTDVFEDMGENIERHVVRAFGDDGAGMIDMHGEGGFKFLFHSGPWSDMEVVALTPGLGDYFGVSEGLLIVRAPKDSSLDLRDGDVIVRLDGNALTDRHDLVDALSKAQRDDTVQFDIVRQRQSMTVDATVPEAATADGEERKVIIRKFHTDED